MENREVLFVRLPVALKERLEESAKENRRSIAKEVQVACEHFLKAK